MPPGAQKSQSSYIPTITYPPLLTRLPRYVFAMPPPTHSPSLTSFDAYFISFHL